jgi:hypothetical protein
MHRAIAVSAVLTVLVVGCTGRGTSMEAEPSTAGPTPSTTGKSGRIEQRFLEREPLESCGTLKVGVSGGGIKKAEAQVRCLQRANRSGEGGELQVITFSEEGDPISYYYRATPEAYGYEVFVDSTADRFGGYRRWELYQCDGVVLAKSGRVECLVE